MASSDFKEYCEAVASTLRRILRLDLSSNEISQLLSQRTSRRLVEAPVQEPQTNSAEILGSSFDESTSRVTISRQLGGWTHTVDIELEPMIGHKETIANGASFHSSPGTEMKFNGQSIGYMCPQASPGDYLVEQQLPSYLVLRRCPENETTFQIIGNAHVIGLDFLVSLVAYSAEHVPYFRGVWDPEDLVLSVAIQQSLRHGDTDYDTIALLLRTDPTREKFSSYFVLDDRVADSRRQVFSFELP